MSYLSFDQQRIVKRNESIEWARNILANKDKYIIIDTETTGLKETDVVIHFAAMDLDRNMLINSLVKPTQKKRMSQDAQNIHGISMSDLKGAPIFEKVLAEFYQVWQDRTILCYNAMFHSDKIDQTIDIDGIAKYDLPYSKFEDIQRRYEYFYNRDYLALPGRDNTGEGDCNAALDAIEEMAAAEIKEVPPAPQQQKIAKKSEPLGCVGWGAVVMMVFAPIMMLDNFRGGFAMLFVGFIILLFSQSGR